MRGPRVQSAPGSGSNIVSILLFLKWGGSLITEKDRPHTHRPQILARLAAELQSTISKEPQMSVLLGHGSGSFGHVPAQKFSTRQGVYTASQWSGFVEVWRQAGELNHLVMRALHEAGLSAIAFPPSTAITAENGKVLTWNLFPIEASLKAGLLPVVFGDVVFDTSLGGTILSTEDLFSHLTGDLKPARVLLAGMDPGVWADYPRCSELVREITPHNYSEISASLKGSESPDVTGGMLGKVESSLALVTKLPTLEVQIFSGKDPGNLQRALSGERLGTIIRGSTL